FWRRVFDHARLAAAESLGRDDAIGPLVRDLQPIGRGAKSNHIAAQKIGRTGATHRNGLSPEQEPAAVSLQIDVAAGVILGLANDDRLDRRLRRGRAADGADQPTKQGRPNHAQARARRWASSSTAWSGIVSRKAAPMVPSISAISPPWARINSAAM